jgi:hypothetical protein
MKHIILGIKLLLHQVYWIGYSDKKEITNNFNNKK